MSLNYDLTYDEILGTMKDKFRELSGAEADDASDVGIRMKVLAGQIFSLVSQSNWLLKQLFPQTAEGKYLDMHAETHAIVRKSVSKATGTLNFSRQTVLQYNVQIPAGTVCGIQGSGKQFVTTQEAVLQAGTLGVNVPAQAAEGGAEYNAAANTITVMINPPQGIAAVTNTLPFSGGGAEESDESLRKRLLESYGETSNGANAAYYRETALKFDEVASAAVLPRVRGRGTVDVVIKTRSITPSAELISKVTAEIQKNREIGTDVLVRGPAVKKLDVSADISVKNGYILSDVISKCKDAVNEYFGSLQIGDDLLRAALGSIIFSVEGVQNYRINSPTADFNSDNDVLLILNTLAVGQLL